MITCIYIDLEQSRFKLSCNVVRDWNSISKAIRSWCMECKKHELETTEDRTKFGIQLSQQGSLSMRMLVFCSRTDLGIWSFFHFLQTIFCFFVDSGIALPIYNRKNITGTPDLRSKIRTTTEHKHPHGEGSLLG